MDKGLTVPKWVLIVQPKIPQMPQNLSSQFVCPSLKFLDFNEKKRLYWVSVVRDAVHVQGIPYLGNFHVQFPKIPNQCYFQTAVGFWRDSRLLQH